jgi:hypothetical protein
VNALIAKFVAWFKGKNITAHSVAVAAIGFATLYSSDEQFRDFVLLLVKNHPKIIADIGMAVTIILKYSHSSSAAGTVATAQKIESSPNPPTPAEVTAATLPLGTTKE